MRKSILIAAGLTAAMSGVAHANATVLVDGTIAVGNPMGSVVGGVSEIASVCDGVPEANGIDGIAFVVPEEVTGTNAKLDTSGDLAIDADVYWYTLSCDLIDDFRMATGAADEAGKVPTDASYGVVDLVLGAAAEVKLTAGL